MNLILGALVWMIVAVFLLFPALSMIGWFLPPVTLMIISTGLSICGFVASLHKTPVGFRGVPLYLGTRWIPFWEDQEGGLKEGWNSTILPYPLADVQDVDCRLKNAEIKQLKAYTKDNVAVVVEAVRQNEIVRPAEYLGAENPEQALNDLILRSIRAAVEDYNAFDEHQENGVKVPGLIREDKKQLSTNIEQEVANDFPADRVRWGMRINFIRISHVALPIELENALRKKVQEPIEGDYEQTQAERRKKQTEEIIALGVDPNIAYPGALVDAEKSGANVSGVTVRGFEDLGPAVKDLGDLGRGIQTAVRSIGNKGSKR